jgi:SAF domain
VRPVLAPLGLSRHRRRALALAIAAIALATAGLDRLGAAPARRAAPVLVQQVVVARAVAAGDRLVRADLATLAVPARYASPHRVGDPAQAVGRRVAVALPAGSPLMDAELRGDVPAADMREVALRLDPAAGAPAGDLAGLRADVFLARPGRPPARVLADVLVVASGRADAGTVATVLLRPAAVTTAIAAEGRGALRLVVRTPEPA